MSTNLKRELLASLALSVTLSERCELRSVTDATSVVVRKRLLRIVERPVYESVFISVFSVI